jgi:pyridoxine kinase
VVLTGVSFEQDLLGSAVSDGTKVEYDFNTRLTRSSHGTGDVFASVFAGAVMRGRSAISAAQLAADIVCEAIQATEDDHWYGVAFEKTIPSLVEKLK